MRRARSGSVSRIAACSGDPSDSVAEAGHDTLLVGTFDVDLYRVDALCSPREGDGDVVPTTGTDDEHVVE